MIPFLAKIDKKKLKEYLKKQKNKINKLFIPNTLYSTQVHKLRKVLKTFYYNIKSLDLNNYDDPIAKNNVLPELLGKWHDCQITIRHLNKAIGSSGLKPKELSQLVSIKKKITSTKNQLFIKIKATILASS